MQLKTSNQDKSAASFCHQVVELGPDMFCDFYLVNIHKIANISTTTRAREKNKYRFGILRIAIKNNIVLTLLEGEQAVCADGKTLDYPDKQAGK